MFSEEEFYIIYEGRIVVETLHDGDNWMELDFLRKGAIVRPYHCLVNRINKVRFRV